jgi:hypothetical protein
MSHHAPTEIIDPRPAWEGLPPDLGRWASTSLLVGLIALALWLLSLLGDRDHAMRSWLFAYVFFIGIPLGSLTFVMMGHLTGGEYAVINRRFGEAAFMTLPVMFLLFLPMCLGLSHIFPWAHLAAFAGDENADFYKVMIHRQGWFNQPVFIIRQFVYFIIWIGLAVYMRTNSLQLDHTDDPYIRARIRRLAAPGILLYFITITSFALDFILSRETNWYSSIIGFLTAIGQGTLAMAFMTWMVCFFANRRPIRNVLKPQHLNDFGNLLLALIILWIYLSFAQFLVIWQGDTKEDVGYYAHRGMGVVPNGWRWIALLLFLGHFLLPFMLLLMKGLKRKVATLSAICVIILFMRVVDCLWVTAPSGPHRNDAGRIFWTDPVAFVAIGGIFLAFFFWNLARHPLLPQNATDQPELVTTHGAAHA